MADLLSEGSDLSLEAFRSWLSAPAVAEREFGMGLEDDPLAVWLFEREGWPCRVGIDEWQLVGDDVWSALPDWAVRFELDYVVCWVDGETVGADALRVLDEVWALVQRGGPR